MCGFYCVQGIPAQSMLPPRARGQPSPRTIHMLVCYMLVQTLHVSKANNMKQTNANADQPTCMTSFDTSRPTGRGSGEATTPEWRPTGPPGSWPEPLLRPSVRRTNTPEIHILHCFFHRIRPFRPNLGFQNFIYLRTNNLRIHPPQMHHKGEGVISRALGIFSHPKDGLPPLLAALARRCAKEKRPPLLQCKIFNPSVFPPKKVTPTPPFSPTQCLPTRIVALFVTHIGQTCGIPRCSLGIVVISPDALGMPPECSDGPKHSGR